MDETTRDRDFILHCVATGNLWALSDRGYQVSQTIVDKETVSEVREILSMWQVLQNSYETLDDKEKLEVSQYSYWDEGRFPGFWATCDVSRYVILDMLINRLATFSELKMRPIDDPRRLDNMRGYRLMLHAYQKLGVARNLNTHQMKQLLGAMESADYTM